MAMYECFESFAAFERVLNDSGPDFEPAARMLVSEYCKYALTRAWYYYSDALPEETIAEKQREANGHVDRKLSFPLEDLYVDGLPAGQVGQEVYGAGAAFIFATRCYHRIEEAPFLLFCNHFLRVMERTSDTTLSISLEGGDRCTAEVYLLRQPRHRLPKVTLLTSDGAEIEPFADGKDRLAFCVPARGRLVLQWT